MLIRWFINLVNAFYNNKALVLKNRKLQERNVVLQKSLIEMHSIIAVFLESMDEHAELIEKNILSKHSDNIQSYDSESDDQQLFSNYCECVVDNMNAWVHDSNIKQITKESLHNLDMKLIEEGLYPE